jgi:hypothetical protein
MATTVPGNGVLAREGAELALDPVSAARFKRAIGSLRDRSRPADERALAGAILADELAGGAAAVASPALNADPAQRMFEYGVLHERAIPWDGRSARSGTITYVALDRVEQYVGQQVWIAYAAADLADYSPEMGDQVRIISRGGSVSLERTAANRLQSGAPSREARSGTTLFFASPVEWAEIESTAQSVAERHSAALSCGEPAASLDFQGAARLSLELLEPGTLPALQAAASVLELPVIAAVRLEVTVRSNHSGPALLAERALTLCAALLTSEGQAVGIDDSGAVFSTAELYLLGIQNEVRADTFAFAAAAARRAFPPPARSLSQDETALDEVAVYSALPWRADFALSSLQRALEELADGGARTGDPIVPPQGAFCGPEERGDPGTLQPLVHLSYEAVQIDISFVAGTAAKGPGSFSERADIGALLGRPIRSVLVFALRARGDETGSDQFFLEMNRADAFVTALAAICARRGDCIAADAGGSLYDLDALLALALHRRGRAASWNARVAAALE